MHGYRQVEGSLIFAPTCAAIFGRLGSNSRLGIKMNGKGVRIRLENGGFAIVDRKDAPLVRSYHWFRMGPKGREYARGWIPQWKKQMAMHRFLVDAPPGLQVDHINRNRVDNRRENLRLVTQSENMRNIAGQRRRRSRYKGVDLHIVRGRGYWRWSIRIHGELRSGPAASEIEAAKKYDWLACLYYPQFAKLNFPRLCRGAGRLRRGKSS